MMETHTDPLAPPPFRVGEVGAPDSRLLDYLEKEPRGVSFSDVVKALEGQPGLAMPDGAVVVTVEVKARWGEHRVRVLVWLTRVEDAGDGVTIQISNLWKGPAKSTDG